MQGSWTFMVNRVDLWITDVCARERKKRCAGSKGLIKMDKKMKLASKIRGLTVTM